MNAELPRRPWYLSRTLLWLLCIFAAFIVTHLPPPPKPAPMILNDKLLHFIGFAALGLLTVWRLGENRHTINPLRLVFYYLLLVTYGLFDEATQELVGRTFEWGDWLADILGAAFGMTIGILCHRYTVRQTVPSGA